MIIKIKDIYIERFFLHTMFRCRDAINDELRIVYHTIRKPTPEIIIVTNIYA
jgi:hypothetical protein